jgi:glyoxylase-like metal-dependent hydrolase (beta-lactamase superfamily II)
MHETEFPLTGSAAVHVLQAGYARDDSGGDRVGSTVTLIQDGDVAVIVDPGMVASRQGLLTALAERGLAPEAVTDIVFSHHHPDHTVNAALFANARIHDHWAVYHGDHWLSREAHGALLAPSVRLLRTPGHTGEDISTIASTADGVYACTHAWWSAQGPEEDPLGTDAAALKASRQLLLQIATVIIPGHGTSFEIGARA